VFSHSFVILISFISVFVFSYLEQKMIRLFWAISTLSFIYCNADIPIERESFICTETSELVDFGQSCKDFTNYEEKKSCNIIKNSINIMRGDTDNEDEFRVVFEMNSEHFSMELKNLGFIQKMES